MVEEVITVNPETKIKHAVELMNENEVGCLVVTRKGKPVGIMTERDVLKNIVCQCKNPEQVRVSEIMSEPLIVGKVNMDWQEAVGLMLKRNIKKLPIVDGKKLVGLVTLTDMRARIGIVDSATNSRHNYRVHFGGGYLFVCKATLR